jgi:hypothetical protein
VFIVGVQVSSIILKQKQRKLINKKQREEIDGIITNGEKNFLLDIKLKQMFIRDKLSIKHIKSRQENIERKERIIGKCFITALLLRKRKITILHFSMNHLLLKQLPMNNCKDILTLFHV